MFAYLDHQSRGVDVQAATQGFANRTAGINDKTRRRKARGEPSGRCPITFDQQNPHRSTGPCHGRHRAWNTSIV
jgi:hypothetical protein